MLLAPWSAPVGFHHRRAQGTQVPFTQMPSRISLLGKQLRNRYLRWRHMPDIGVEDAVTVRVTAGEHTSPRRVTNRRRGVEAIQTDSIGCHLVQVRRPQPWMTMIGRVSPSLVITHHQNDIRVIRRPHLARQHKPQPQQKAGPPKTALHLHRGGHAGCCET